MKNPPKKVGDVLKCPKNAEENFLLILCPLNTLHKYHAGFWGDE
jgi:hypothetical protein